MVAYFQLSREGQLLYDSAAGSRHKQILAYADAIFGSYCLVLATVALWAWWRGEGSLWTPAAIVLFIIVNVLISQFAKRRANPQPGEVIRILAGLIITPLVYLLITDPFDRWWPGFLIMCLGGALIWGFLTIKPYAGRLLVVYYVGLFVAAELLRGEPHNWYMVLATAGAIAIASLVLAEVVSLLGMAISSERAQKEQLEAANCSLEAEIAERKRIVMELQAAKEAAEAAFAERRRLVALIESATDYIGIADLQGWSIYINQAGREMMGKPEEDEDEEAWNVANCYPAHVEDKLLDMMETVLGGQSWSGEMALLHEDGHEIPVSEVTFLLPDDEGKPEYIGTIIHDITALKQTESELKQARDTAEAANRAKSTFLANMSHEIRTPMNAVIGMTGLLLNTPLDEKQRDFVETIRTAGDSLLAIINDILDFSKIEASKLELERYPLDLRACIESALDLMAPRAAEKGLELVYQMDEGTPAGIVGDVTRLRQILVNLMSNAIKFTEQGEVVVSVTSEEVAVRSAGRRSRKAQNTHQLHFTVRDTGIGIAPERRSRLFKSFSQLDPSTTREYGGTGLGLAISKRLVELMGGRMSVESEGVGQGTTFHFTLTTQAAAVPARSHLRNPRPELRGKRVLVVDDNKTNRHILCLQAEMWGMTPHCAASPSEALAVLSEGESFDLAILDMYLPEMDGLNLAMAIRQQPGRELLPLVMLTSVNRARTIIEAEAAGFAAFLTKPVKPSQLYDVLVSILAGQGDGELRLAPAGMRTSGPLAERLPLRILLVEDVAVNQKFALQALEQIGYQADVAGNGLEALSAVGRQPYDVILMDVQMPEMDGLEATRRIHQIWNHGLSKLPTAQRPRIIAMTANALQGDREMCLAAGMDDYISKPVYLEELYAALERAAPAGGEERGEGSEERLAVSSEQLAVSSEQLAVSSEEPIDQGVLEKILKRTSGREVIALYLEEAAGLVGAVRAAEVVGDAPALAQAAHSLKGSSGYVGARRLVELSSELERMGRAGSTEAAASVVAQLAAEFERVRQALAAGS